MMMMMMKHSHYRSLLSLLLVVLLSLSLCCCEAIIGGGIVRSSGYPYFTLLEVRSEVDGQEVLHYCGGVLIHSDIVLTSAFCDRGRIVASASVNETSFKEGMRNTPPLRSDRIVNNVVKHPNFTDATINDDLMLIQLHQPVDQEPAKIDRCVNRPETDPQQVTTVGLGFTSNIGSVDPDFLQQVQYPTVPHAICNEQLTENISSEHHICAGRQGAGACVGDAGGPLVIVTDGEPENDWLVGIVSMSDEGRCGESGKPGLYTRVFPYLQWIDDTICELSKAPPSCCETNSCTACPAPAIGGFCFSGQTQVTTEQQGIIPMSKLQVGDKVLSSSSSSEGGKPIYDTVYSFGHYQPNVVGQYLKLSFEKKTQDNNIPPLEITPDHLVFVPSSANKKNKAIPASQIKVGDQIIFIGSNNNHNNNDAIRVTKIESTTSRGAYSPFTYSGQLVVNSGLLVSNFITMQQQPNFDTLRLFGINTFITHHTIAHVFETPHRMLSKLSLSFMMQEEYNPENGLLKFWIDEPHRMAKQILQLPSYQMFMILLPLFILFGSLRLMELLVFDLAGNYSVFFVAAVAVVVTMYYQKKGNKKMKVCY